MTEGIEPSLLATVARIDQDEPSPVPGYPQEFRACSQVCRAPIGERCFSLSGTIVGGRPDSVRTYLNVPHAARKRRVKRAKR